MKSVCFKEQIIFSLFVSFLLHNIKHLEAAPERGAEFMYEPEKANQIGEIKKMAKSSVC